MENINKQELIDFEQWCADTYHDKKIMSPMHLSGSVDGKLEDFLIELFKEIGSNDWIFTTYRSHYHALLKGVDKEWIKKWILENKSIHLMNKEHRIISSAIVGGTLSQGVGAALAIKLKGEKNKVWCFCGDMTASLGIFKDCLKFSLANNLPINFVIEDNGLSTDTPTNEAWNESVDAVLSSLINNSISKVRYIKYQRKWPHYGTGKRIDFQDDKT